MPRTLRKVLGGGSRDYIGRFQRLYALTPNLVFCFGPKLWFWPRPKLNNKGPFIYYKIQVGGRGGVSESMTHYDREGGGGMNNYDV